MNIVIAEMIKKLRTEKGISQEKLAEQVGVSVQAVSKWENGLSCPDISLLPELGEFFGVTADYLLTGKESAVQAECGLPDDGKLRIVQAMGNKILGQNEFDGRLVIKLQMPNPSEQPSLNVDIWSGCTIEGDVNGNIQCGDGVNCGNVGGSVTAGDDIHCGDIGANASAGGDIECSVIHGNVQSCEGDIDCTEIQGDVRCEGDITIHKDKPNRKTLSDNGFFNKK